METRYLDQLEEFYCRDWDRIEVGQIILFGHVPTLENVEWAECKASVYGEVVTILEKRYASFNELNGFHNTDEWATKLAPMLYVESESGYKSWRHATDAGIVKYDGTWYNPVNFTVIMSDVTDKFDDVLLAGSPEYLVRLEDYNSKVVVFDHDYDY